MMAGAALGIAAIVLAIAFSAVLWLISARYAPRFEGRRRVAMNWSLFNGKPDFYASPRVALSVTPVIGTISLLLIAGLIALATPSQQRLIALPAIIFAGAVLAAIHATHMHFAARLDDGK